MNFFNDIKVLLVEDDKEINHKMQSILSKYFKYIDIAYDGEEGLKKAKQNDYDIVISDIMMPCLDGIEMIKKIKQFKNPKFIIISAYTDKEFFIKLIEVGIHGYLIKPISSKQLLLTLKKIIEEIQKDRMIIEKNEEIEKLSKVKSEFLANMSHEIRTPLNAILGFIKVMKEEDKGKFKKYLDIIDSSSQTLLTIINDILDFSKIEAGKLNIEYIDFNKEEIFHTIELFKEIAQEKNINFKIKSYNIPLYLYGDIHRIKQVITNLLSNAIKFTPQNKQIETIIKYENNKFYLEVKDEGIGISKDKQKIIFDAFSQADSSIERTYGGSGLGLTISYKLVKLMKGKLEVESEEGKGSKFYFEIPIKKGKKIEEKVIKSHFHKNLFILVAEDNKANQMFMKVILDKMKIKFDIANNGEEAIELAKKNHYDLILMDISMPMMNGLEATKEIRKFSNIPIIALTANVIEENKEKFLRAGMDDCLSKPLEIEQLNIAIEKFQK